MMNQDLPTVNLGDGSPLTRDIICESDSKASTSSQSAVTDGLD